MSLALRAELLNRCQALGVELHSLQLVEVEEDVLTALLQDAIDLRSGGSNELSLQLLDAAVEFGVRSGLVDDNRAWALVGLGRRMEAIGLWNELADHPDEGLRVQAQENVRLLVAELSKQLIELAEAAGESLPEVAGREFSGLAEFEQPLVDASIRLRSGGSNELSLQLLDAAVEFGVRSGLVDDNRAWALVGLGRRMEAIGLWNELADHPDEGLRVQAQENVRLLVAELSKQLIELAEAAGESLPEVAGREFSGLAEFEQPLVDASIRLRSGGSNELSLQLLDAAVEFGVRSGLVDDNRAWALVGLGRRMEAIGLWNELADHPDEGLRVQAQENVRLLVAELSKQLIELAEAAGESLPEVAGREFSGLAEFEQPLVDASIRLRSGGSNELSLQLLDAAVEFGVRSGLVDDNRAWALVGLGRRMEAIGLWNELADHPDEGLRVQAQENVRLLVAELSKQLIELAEAAGESLPEVAGREFSGLAEFEQPLVDASIRLRSGGSNELSLQLLDAAVEFGVRSGLVDDNRAWALVGLGRRMEAIGLWNELADHPDEGLRVQAQENVRLLVAELSKQLIELAEAAGESLPEVAGREFSGLAEFEQPLVDASIRLRSGGSNELSLQLLDAAVEFGVRSGLVDDNRAWALVGLGRRMEAIGLWNELADHPDEGLRVQAQENVRLLVAELSKQLIELAEAAGESLPEVAGREFSGLAEFEQPLVDASIRLRSGGSNELSLQLLDAAVEFGVRSGLVDDNRAWALVGLGRRMEAIGLWNELADHPDEGLRVQAQENVRLLVAELSKQLIELAEAAGESLPEVAGREFSGLAEFEQPLVDASIRLRSGGSNELSLQLLDAAVEFGVRSGLVDDNRAWALVGLGRRMEAIGLWNELADHPDEGLRVQAQENVRLLVAELSKQLIELAEAAGESLPEVAGREFSGLAEFEQPLVDASIRLRSGGSNELSLQLLDAAVEFGVRSGLVDDNRAWALVGLGRLPEAVGLWRELEASTDNVDLVHMARERLQSYATEADRLVATNKAQVLVDEGHIDQAKTVLIQAMLDDPSWDGYTTALIQVLKTERGGDKEVADLLKRELEEDQLNLEAYDEYLDLVEQRLNDAAVSSSF